MIPGLCSIFYKAGTTGNFSAVASPPSVGGSDTSGSVTSSAAMAKPIGGVGPYTYSWIFQSGSSSIHADSPTAATTTFTGFLFSHDFVTASFLCRVTDSLAAVAETNLVNISLRATGS